MNLTSNFHSKLRKMKTRKPNRLREYDYSASGWYFVTICTQKHIPFFGKVENGKMKLNRYGKIVRNYWKKIENLHSDIQLDYFIIMPNHIHGIIIINSVGDANFASPTNDRTKMKLSKIIQQFKRAVTIDFRKNGNSNFKWQRSFYDRIIRNEDELFKIRKYVRENPLSWEIDKETENLNL